MAKKIAFKVYPNPTEDHFLIRSTISNNISYQWQLQNNLGKLLKRGTIQNRTESVNIENLSSGIYYLSIIGEKGERLHFEKVVIINR